MGRVKTLRTSKAVKGTAVGILKGSGLVPPRAAWRIKMHHILVCDDNVSFVKVMVIILEKYKDLYDIAIESFCNGQELLEYCAVGQFDIIYMDIALGRENGMDIAKTLKKINPRVLIIYISVYDCYYEKMVQAEPFRFISKNLAQNDGLEAEIADTLQAAIKRIEGKELWSFGFKRERYFVEMKKIKFFRSIGRKIHIIGELGDTPGYCYGRMEDLQEELERISDSFGRINKSYIVNFLYARPVGKNKMEIDGNILSISAKYRAAFLTRYNNYWQIGS